MVRYFVALQYNGSQYSGWQLQPNAPTIQQEIEDKISKLLGYHVPIMGCGRTDAGVHALDFFFHMDTENALDEQFIFKMNMMLPKDVALKNAFQVKEKAHARFDAISRSYTYHIHRLKNPFNYGLSYYYPHLFTFDLSVLNDVASLFLNYDDFYPFCKTNTDVKTTKCSLTKSLWEIQEDTLTYQVSANRFLRGMVRLMVGCCINVTMGKLTLEEVDLALKSSHRLQKDLSVPAQGLYLRDIQYPETIHKAGSPPYIY